MHEKKKNVLVIGGIKVFFDRLKNFNVKTTLLMSKDFINNYLLNDADKTLILDLSNINETIAIINNLNDVEKFDAIFCVDERLQHLAAEVAINLNLLFTSPKAIDFTLNKHKLRKLLNENNISVVNYMMCNNSSDLLLFAKKNKFPFIVKPTNETASINVYRINNDLELQKFINSIHNSELNLSFPLLVEEYLEGIEVSVETITIDGIHKIVTATEKIKKDGTFVEIGHTVPYQIDKNTLKEIEFNINNMFSLLEHNIGLGHTEFMLTKNGPKIIESHVRMGGDYIFQIIENASGKNIIDIIIKHQLGLNVDMQFNFIKYSTIRYLDVIPGKVSKIAGESLIKQIPGVKKLRISVELGDMVNELKHSLDRVGYVIIDANSPEEAEKIYQKVKNTLEIITI